MKRSYWLGVGLFVLTLSGCSLGGTSISILFSPPVGPIPPGESAEARVTVRFGGPGDSWAGRKVRVAIRAPADLTVNPSEAEVTLDDRGTAVVRLSITPSKDAPPGPRTMLITATGSENACTTLDVDVSVK